MIFVINMKVQLEPAFQHNVQVEFFTNSNYRTFTCELTKDQAIELRDRLNVCIQNSKK